MQTWVRKSKIFISYSSKDANLVVAITKLLKIRSNRVFLDRESIEPGDLWEDVLNSALENADQVIVFWCCHSSESKWVDYEIEKSVQLGKSIIPVLLCTFPVHSYLKKFQWIDMQDVVLHNCNPHEYSEPSIVTVNELIPPKRFSYTSPTIISDKSNFWIISLDILTILSVIIRPIPAFLGDQLAVSTNIFLLIACLLVPIYLIYNWRKKLPKLRRAAKLSYFLEAAIEMAEEQPFIFHPKK